MTKKKPAPYTGPALIEGNLPAYDKNELEAERALRKKVQDCKDAAGVAKKQIDGLKKEQKSLDKKAPDYKAKSKEIAAKMKALQGVAKKKCTLSHPGCVASDKSKRVLMPKEMTDGINQKNGTKVDFAKLSAWEGGAYQKGYIPWWPLLDSNGAPTVAAMADSSGGVGPRLKGSLDGKPKNKSGATVGVGVDLGQGNEKDYFKLLGKANRNSPLLTADELDALKKKIRPYLNQQGGEACKFLREHPLELSEKEINFLSRTAHEEALANAKAKYEAFANAKVNSNIVTAPKKFADLTAEQQTALLSNGYQYGSPKPDMIKAVATNDKAIIPKDVREHDYLFNSMPAPDKKP